jgi:hypothetical protein
LESSSGKTITLKAKTSDRTEDMQVKIQETGEIPCHHQVMYFAGEEIKGDQHMMLQYQNRIYTPPWSVAS